MGGTFQWPGLKEVMEYRETVRELVCDVISSSPLSLPVSMDNPWVRVDLLLLPYLEAKVQYQLQRYTGFN